MIYFFTPYLKDNLGSAYNHYCSLVPNNDDWITFMDGDVMQMHMNWADIWSDIIINNEDAGIITCVTNRVSKNNIDQVEHSMYDEKDILSHKNYAKKLYDSIGNETKEMKGTFLSGFFFSFKKKTWLECGGFSDGILHVDANFYQKIKKIGKKCLVAKGFYVLHYYRMGEGEKYTDHLIKK